MTNKYRNSLKKLLLHEYKNKSSQIKIKIKTKHFNEIKINAYRLINDGEDIKEFGIMLIFIDQQISERIVEQKNEIINCFIQVILSSLRNMEGHEGIWNKLPKIIDGSFVKYLKAFDNIIAIKQMHLEVLNIIIEKLLKPENLNGKK